MQVYNQVYLEGGVDRASTIRVLYVHAPTRHVSRTYIYVVHVYMLFSAEARLLASAKGLFFPHWGLVYVLAGRSGPGLRACVFQGAAGDAWTHHYQPTHPISFLHTGGCGVRRPCWRAATSRGAWPP